MPEVSQEVLEQTLLSELSANSEQVAKLEGELRSMYTALPKGHFGTLEPATVRYALHRYFVQKYGWYLRGLEPAGQTWNSSSATSVMADRAPAYIEELFEKRLHGQGLGLHELAAFAATLTDLVHKEAFGHVVDIYERLDLPTVGHFPAMADRAILAYMLQFLHGNLVLKSTAAIGRAEKDMQQNFPAWTEFKMWVTDVRRTIAMERSRKSFKREEPFDNVVEEIQEINHRIGAFQNIECRSLKAILSDVEEGATGRVLLAEFYRIGLEGDWMFKEKIEYLRDVGALDENDPKRPMLIIPNYIASQANCLASSGFHSVCCMDECEGLMAHVERAIGAPSASVGRIVEVVAGMQSDTVDAPRNLSTALLSRLGEISEHHGGQVPLHARLFAQWMHHAYPLECPFPHVAGTINPLTPDEWMTAVGTSDVAASPKDIMVHVASAEKPDKDMEALPWDGIEELVGTHKQRPEGSSRNIVRKVAAIVALAALAFPVAQMSKAAVVQFQPELQKQHMV